MSDSAKSNGVVGDRLAHLPADLRERIASEVNPGRLSGFSAYDLSSHGQYSTGYLVLTEGRLGHFFNGDGAWHSQWTDVATVKDARLVEGLGMSMLRLTGEDSLLAEYRYTNRHAKTMAELQHQLERHIAGKEPDCDSRHDHGPPDKKVRCDKCGSAIPDWAESCPACLHQRKVLMRLLEFIRPHKWRAIAGFAIGLLILVLGLFRPLMSKWLVDWAIMGRNYGVLWWLVAGFAVILFGEAFLDGLRARLMAGLGTRVAAELRDRCYRHLHKLSLSYFSRKPTGSLITRVTSDSDRIWDFLAFNLVDTVVSLLTFVGVGIMLFLINWRLALLVLIPIPLMMFAMVVFHNRMHGVFQRIWHRWSAMTAVVADAIPGVRVIKAFGQEQREVDRFHKSNYQVYDEELALINIWTMFGPIMGMASQVGFIIIWSVGGYWAIQDLPAAGQQAAQGAMTVGTLLAFQGYMWMFYGPVHQVAHMSRQFNRAATSVQRILEVLDTQPEIFTKRDAQPLKQLEGRIELRNVSFSYDGVRRVLRDVSMVVQPGEMIGLAGPSGSGKTTLVNLLCRFYDVTEGQILIDGVDIRDYDVDDMRRFIGVVLQEPFLFHGTIAENIAYGHPQSTRRNILDAARAANVHDAIVGFPDGYDTLVGERGHTLSGGERQRISIARAILNNPRLLILDEATSSVDTNTEKQIQEALDRLVANRTTFAIAHRLSTLQRASRLVVLEKGKIVEQGTHAELQAKPDGVYAKLLKMQTDMKSIVAIDG